MDRMKELTKLAKQAIKVAEGVPESKSEQPKPTEVGAVVTISNPDANVFSQNIFDRAAEMKKQGMAEVEVQYATNILSNAPSGPILIHCALLIGRRYADSSIK